MKKLIKFLFLAAVCGSVMTACQSSETSDNKESQEVTNVEQTTESEDEIVLEGIVGPSAVTRGGSSDRTFVKTNSKCKKCWSTGTRGCTGYWGYKHGNGTYEGPCQNSDGYGHKCGHSPEQHGLKKW